MEAQNPRSEAQGVKISCRRYFKHTGWKTPSNRWRMTTWIFGSRPDLRSARPEKPSGNHHVHIRGLKGPENLAQALARVYISNGSTLKGWQKYRTV
jgi:hypothetical protein